MATLSDAFLDATGEDVPAALVGPLQSLAVHYALGERALAGHWEAFVMTRPGLVAGAVTADLIQPFSLYLELRCGVAAAPAEAPSPGRVAASPQQARATPRVADALSEAVGCRRWRRRSTVRTASPRSLC